MLHAAGPDGPGGKAIGALAAIVPANRFYAPRLAAAGVDASIGSLAEFSARMPFTTKAELVADQAAQLGVAVDDHHVSSGNRHTAR